MDVSGLALAPLGAYAQAVNLTRWSKRRECDVYEVEKLDEDDDNGTMPENVERLRSAVVGHKIVSAVEDKEIPTRWGGTARAFVITLDNGRRVALADTNDCCAYTSLEKFLLNVDRVDHIITGVGTTDGYEKWHIFADLGDVLTLEVGWSTGNPFYYGYGFDITVQDAQS